MKKATILAAALLATMSSVALAQNSPGATPKAAAKSAQDNGANLRQQMTTDLQQSGFKNVRVMPDSFLVQANDKAGNPVTMFITPNSVAEVATVGSNNSNNSDNSNNQSTGAFATISTKDDLSSKAVGLDVYNDANQNIGTIKDIAFNGNQLNGYILAVGGFLGLGDHYVAVRPGALNINYNAGENKWHAKMNTTAEQLKAAPEYKYPSKT